MNNIAGSLQQGKFITGSLTAFIYVVLSVMLLLPGLTIVLLIVSLTVGMYWHVEMIVSLTGCNIFAGFIIVIFLCIIVRNKQLKAKVNLWLKDAVRIKARTRTIDSIRLGIQPKQVKMKVDFTFNGKNYSRVSAGKMFGSRYEGYHKIWAKYADKEIEILYSAKYDQVLILKNK